MTFFQLVAFLSLSLALLLAGVLTGWLGSARAAGAKATRGRIRRPGWLVALAALTAGVLGWIALISHRSGSNWWVLIVPLLVALILAVRPWLAEVVVPAGLVAFSLFGLVLARSYLTTADAFVSLAVPTPSGGSPPSPRPLMTQDPADWFVLPLAFGCLLLGGWLTWRSGHPLLSSWRRWLSRLASQAPRAQLRALLLIPVALMGAELVTSPGFSAGTASLWILVWLGAAVTVLRRWPGAAARLAVAGLLLLGVAGLALATTFQYGSSRSDYGVVVLAGRHSGGLVAAQAIVLLAAGAWLVPQTFPSARRLLGLPPDPELTRQVQQLTESRAVVMDTAASDFRRLERDLHDGAQARLVALGMSLRAAERLIPVNPDAALALVAEARETSARALTELRELVRGVHPPVLADRGLGDAMRALALDSPLAVQTKIDLPGRVPAPVETASYFAVAELLTNAAKHSGARDALIDVRHGDGRLRIEVTDFGLGGANPAAGSGLAGVEKRLAAFDGIMAISSPAGGPTIVVLEVPCALSSPKTSTC
jgi:signal transduction histidine kinase